MKLKKIIEETEGIPTYLQMLTHRGKLLKSSTVRHVEQNDTVHLIVRGRGGGKPKKETKKIQYGPPDTASEDEVREWLVKEVRVPAECLNSVLDQMNGDMLHSYETTQEMKDELQIPIGIAKKILHFRDNSHTDFILGFQRDVLESFHTDTIATIASNCLSDDSQSIADDVKQAFVDGFVCMLYMRDINQFSDDLSIPKVKARKFLLSVKRFVSDRTSPETRTEIAKVDPKQKKKEDETVEVETTPRFEDKVSHEKAVPTEMLAHPKSHENTASTEVDVHPKSHENITPTEVYAHPKSHENTAPTEVYAHPKSHENTVPNEVPAQPQDEYRFLGELGLEKTETSDNASVRCRLHGIHNAWDSGNELSHMFLFWILWNENDICDTKDKEQIWKCITGDMKRWVDILPDNLKKDFTPGKSANRFQYKNTKSVCVNSQGATMRCHDKISSEQRKRFQKHILLVHENVNTTGKIAIISSEQEIVRVVRPFKPVWTYCDGSIKFHNEEIKSFGSVENINRSNNPSSFAPDFAENATSAAGLNCINRRPFKNAGTNIIYSKDYVLDRPECGSGMIIPSLEFKLFASSLESKPVDKFLSETLRFACGCLNRRRNGTIYFGIADDKAVEEEKCIRAHGQVVGFPILQVDQNSKSKYTDELQQAKSKCFTTPEANEAAKECIQDPVFVKVAPSPDHMPLYVMEVDIEPSIRFCRRITFKLDMFKVSKKKVHPAIHVRDGARTCSLNGEAEESNFALKLSDYDKKREFEETTLNRQISVDATRKYQAESLSYKLCRGSNTFDSASWPILLSSKPNNHLKTNLYEMLSFVQNVPWVAVFDFDDNYDGMCKHFFNTNQTNVISGDMFRDVESNTDLRRELKIPEKNVFMFCNGRSDKKEPHLLGRREWKKRYAGNVKAAINFFQQKTVVPTERALIICLLFSDEFEGFYDTFEDFTTFFPREQIVLLCEDKHVFENFKQRVLLQGISSEEELKEICVVGMTWTQTNACFNRLLGVEYIAETMIPTSSGEYVKVAKNVEEGISSLKILSCLQCEDKTFTSQTDRERFSREKEIKFYQGNRVEWWNFFFNSHVMERHCFGKLKGKVNDALNHKSQGKRVSTITLIHEPGAGGSTLARHILWTFRKECRCAVVKAMQQETATDINLLWRYQESDLKHALPVLLLIDALTEQQTDINELSKLVTTNAVKCEQQLKSTICVFLICRRDEGLLSGPKGLMSDVPFTQILPQRVEGQEKGWLIQKVQELESTSNDLGLETYKGEYFISFMILHSNFNNDIIVETVKKLLSPLSFQNTDFKLLMYVALIVAFVSPPKGGAAIAIPTEAFNEFMGVRRLDPNNHTVKMWEHQLCTPLKILLVIEQKEKGSGTQIRMAHPNLAKALIECIKVNFVDTEGRAISLLKIVCDFLNSDVPKTRSYAKTYVHQLIGEMLTRRKKEEYDDEENTYFSPLVERIEDESGSFKNAASVLQCGFDLCDVQNGYIAQQLSRLYLKHEDFEQAKTWAETAVQLGPQKSSFIHTLGRVYKNQLQNLPLWQSKVSPRDATLNEALTIAFRSLELFEESSKCEKQDINLLAYLDVFSTIIVIGNLINDVVKLDANEFLRYLTDEDYIPADLTDWCHAKFKSLYVKGLKAVEVLDEYINFNMFVYAVPTFNQQKAEEHKQSKTIKRRLPDMYTDFVKFFVEADTNDVPEYLTSPHLRDEWHRRYVVGKNARRFTDIFRLVKSQKHKKGKHLENCFADVKQHLLQISEKTPSDLINLISVNLALSQLSAAKVQSRSDLLNYCFEIIRSGTRDMNLKMAYMFDIMLQWPVKPVPSEEDADLSCVIKAMAFLSRQFENQKQRIVKQKSDAELFKREKNEFRSKVLFYMAKGRGLSSFCHSCQLPDMRESTSAGFWESRIVEEKLLLLKGHTKLKQNSYTVSVVVDFTELELDGQLELRNLKCAPQELSERPISFYLGFSLSGPVVCYIRSRDVNHIWSQCLTRTTCYNEMTEKELLELQEQVNSLKSRRPIARSSDMTEGEKQLLQDQKQIDDAILKLREDESHLY